jgi:hypothetical protein
MEKFILLYKGPATPPGASHKEWPAWFNKVGDKLVDRGLPMKDGHVLHSDGSISDSATGLNGFSIIQAEDIHDVISLVKDHLFLSLGNGEYNIEIFNLS